LDRLLDALAGPSKSRGPEVGAKSIGVFARLFSARMKLVDGSRIGMAIEVAHIGSRSKESLKIFAPVVGHRWLRVRAVLAVAVHTTTGPLGSDRWEVAPHGHFGDVCNSC